MLMKREIIIFSFGKYSDEKKIKRYHSVLQRFIWKIHQIIVFSLIIKPYENDNRRSKKR